MKKIFILAISFIFVTTACTAGEQEVVSDILVGDPAATTAPTQTSAPVEDMEDTDENDDMADDDDMDAHEESGMEEEVEMDDKDEMIKPEAKAEMMASAPSEFMIASGDYQFVEFFAYWCSSCKAMSPLIHQLEVDYYGDIAFTYLDIDDPATKDFKTQLGYLYQPHYFLLSPEGEVLGQWTGFVEKQTLMDAFAVLQ